MKKPTTRIVYSKLSGALLSVLALLLACAGPGAGPLEPEDRIEIGVGRGDRGQSFTAATWNVRQLTNNSAQMMVSVLPAGGNNTPSKKDAIFALLEKFSIEIVALQEVHESNGAIALGSQNGYTLIKGQKIVENINLGPEYCPVAYKEAVFDCSDYGTGWESGGRSIHWIKCNFDADRLLPPPRKKEFYYGCGHFGTGTEANPNIIALFRYLDNSHAASTTPALPNKQPPRPLVKKGAQKDNFILGMDANSYRYGMKQTIWKRAYERWKNDNSPLTQDIVLEPTAPAAANGGFTKFLKTTNAAGMEVWSLPAEIARIVDELLWSLNDDIRYVPGSKRPAPIMSLRDPVRYPVAHLNVIAFMLELYKLSDHVLLQAEFRY